MNMTTGCRLMTALLALGCSVNLWASTGADSTGDTERGRLLLLATGNASNIYHAFGQTIAQAAVGDGLSIQVLPTKGSVDNLERLTSGQVDLCLAQSDMAYDCFHGVGKFTRPATNLTAVAPIYTEAVHILIRNRMQVKRIQDFAGKRVAMGALGSGSEVIARRFLDASGLSISEIEPAYLDIADSLKALEQDKVDAVFIMSGYPSEAVETALKTGKASLFEPNVDVCERLIAGYPFLTITTIPNQTYSGQHDDISTIGVRALLLSRADFDETLSHAMAKAVDTCHRVKSGPIRIPKADAGWKMSAVVPLAPGALRYYTESGLARQLTIKKYMGYFFTILLAAVVISIFARFQNIRRWSRSDGGAIWLAAGGLIFVWATGSLVLYYAEHKINDCYGTIFLSFWSSLINWLNFGAKEPYTLIGRITTTIMMGLGAGGVFWFARNIWKGLKRMKTRHTDHYVIINWNSKIERLLKQLRNPDFKDKKDIVVILPMTLKEPENFLNDDRVTYIKSGGLTESALADACVKEAHSVIILADETSDAETADAKTILAILAVRHLQSPDGRKIPIVAEIRNPQRMNLAIYAGVTENGSVEVVSSEHLGAKLLCQAAVTAGVTHVYEDLLTFEKNSSEIYALNIPPEVSGRLFADVCRHAAMKRAENPPVIPIGIKRGETMHLNPEPSAIAHLQTGDILFAICDNAESLKKLMESIKKER